MKQGTLLGFFTPKAAAAAKKKKKTGNDSSGAASVKSAAEETPSSGGSGGDVSPARGGASPSEKKQLLFSSPKTPAAAGRGQQAKPTARDDRRGDGVDAKAPAFLSQTQATQVTKLTPDAPQEEGGEPRPKRAKAAEQEEAAVESAKKATEEAYESRGGRRTKRIRYVESDSGESEGEGHEPSASAARPTQQKRGDDKAAKKGPQAQRRRLQRGGSEDSSGSEDEYKPAGATSEEEEEMDEETLAALEMLEESSSASEAAASEPPTPPPKKKAAPKAKARAAPAAAARRASGGGGAGLRGSSSPSSGSGSGSGGMLAMPVSEFESKMMAASADTPKPGTKKGATDVRRSWLSRPLDKNKNPPGHPDHDPTTLYIPASAWSGLSPFEHQYFNIKQNMWDTILFFKKGKFYELYERDALAANSEFNLKISDRVNMMLAGVPESSFTEWASKFLGLGYKVARVDERESMLAKQIREKAGSSSSAAAKPKSKIIERELKAVFTAGTLMGDFLTSDMSNYIMSIKEDPSRREYGVCFADTATAEFNLCHFVDDSAGTHLETLIVQTMPKEVVYPKGCLSKETMAVIKQSVGGAQFSPLEPEHQFWDAGTTVTNLELGKYFANRSAEENGGAGASGQQQRGEGEDGVYARWPVALQTAMDVPIMMSAFGGLVSYFRTLLLDENLLGQGSFRPYDPLQHGASLLLDGQTLLNLEILENNIDRGRKGTLVSLLCHCSSPFGRRLFHRWLCHPLRSVAAIEDRLSAVEDLASAPELTERLKALLKATPDLERLLSRVHVGNCKFADFVALLESLQDIRRTVDDMQDDVQALRSPRLRKLLSAGALFPDMSAPLARLGEMFDLKLAKRAGQVLPTRGVDAAYDELCGSVDTLEAKLERHLKEVRFKLGAKHKVEFWHPSSGKEVYQIVVPVAAASKVPNSWQIKSSTKTVKRYWSPEVASTVPELVEARELQRQAVVGFYKTILTAFDGFSAQFAGASACLAEVDCLLSLLKAKDGMGSPMCKPVFLPASSSKDGGGAAAVLDVEELRHPCLVDSGAVSDYIPNDTRLGGDHEQMVVLTGPNMGGKSTLLRQTCIAVIMAQLGCWVPAKSMRLTPVDRIFTRIGANDNIVAGRSTFMVELKETASILNQATKDSLVILDELGRGTSTFDGYSIAHAVLSHLVDKTGCRGLFATHYHMLTDEFADHPAIAMKNMACVVEEGQRDVTFLYKLTPGVCSKSYGMNVAAMAGMPGSIVDKAEAKAKQFEAASQFGLITERVAARRERTTIFQELCRLAECDASSISPPRLQQLVRRAKALSGGSS